MKKVKISDLGRTAGRKIYDAKKTTKRLRWLQWVANVATNRGLVTCLHHCAYGQTHRVAEVHPIGSAFVFKSSSCSGCPVPCILIEQGFMVSEKPLQVGEEIKLPQYSAPNIDTRVNNTFKQLMDQMLNDIPDPEF